MAKIIAELCQNHKGDWNILKDMIWSAAESGADYAKVQSMLAEELTNRPEIEKLVNRPFQAEYDRIKPFDLTDEKYIQFVEECKKAGIKPLTTVFTRQRIPFIASLGMEAVKVASYDCASFRMIRELKDKFKHLYISTGATLDSEIEQTAQELQGSSFSLLHCTTIYPTPMNELHLARMEYLKRFTPSVGFSDHSLVERDGLQASLIAIALGANVIERHFTILGPNETKDGPVSINPKQLEELVSFAKQEPEKIMEHIRNTMGDYSMVFGNKTRELSEKELLNRSYYRGRFASKVDGKIIYNWEEKKVF